MGRREGRNIGMSMRHDSNLTFGGWLRQVRRDSGRTQQEVGEAIGKDQSKISDLERGMSPSLTASEVRALADFLRVPVDVPMRLSGHWMLTDTSELLEDSRTERLTAIWRSLPDDKRDTLLLVADGLSRAA